jgi:hypothetical protein
VLSVVSVFSMSLWCHNYVVVSIAAPITITLVLAILGLGLLVCNKRPSAAAKSGRRTKGPRGCLFACGIRPFVAHLGLFPPLKTSRQLGFCTVFWLCPGVPARRGPARMSTPVAPSQTSPGLPRPSLRRPSVFAFAAFPIHVGRTLAAHTDRRAISLRRPRPTSHHPLKTNVHARSPLPNFPGGIYPHRFRHFPGTGGAKASLTLYFRRDGG